MNIPFRLIMSALFTSVAAATSHAGDFRDHLGIQLYSLRAQFKEDAIAALDLTRSYGITYVETAGTAGMTPEAFRAELDKRGFKAVAAHVQYGDLQKDLTKSVAEVKTLGATYAFVPWIPHEGAFDSAAGQVAAANLEKWGAVFRAAGIRFGYHPHGYEFAPGAAAGTTVFDEMVAKTTPENVCFELDVFWAHHAGIDPAALLRKYPDRWVALHVKDMRKGAETGHATGRAPATDKVAVGEGQIDTPGVLRAAQEVGVVYYFVEDETPAPLESIPASLKYLRALEL